MKHKVDIVCIQETKKESFERNTCQSMWGDSSVSWDFVPSIQSSGGLVCLWNNSDFQVERRVKGRNFLMLEGNWMKDNQRIRVVNVYAPRAKGGLGIKDIKALNNALLIKWKWLMFHPSDQLWSRILFSKYNGWRGLDQRPSKKYFSQ